MTMIKIVFFTHECKLNISHPLCKVTYATDATTDECGDAATSYYKEFIYNGKRVIVSNNVKNLIK